MRTVLIASVLWLSAGLAWVRPVGAAQPVVVLSTAVETSGAPVTLRETASQLDELLVEAVADFELEPKTGLEKGAGAPGHLATERELVEIAQRAWVVAPSLFLGPRGGMWVRLAVVARGSETIWVRSDYAGEGQLTIRALGLLRELLASEQHSVSEAVPCASDSQLTRPEKRSAGGAVLAAQAAALGGYLGVALQRASGSRDLRLAYPLAALGAGVGLAASMVVSEEWDVTPAASWYLGASALWPTVGTLLLVPSTEARPREDRHLLALLGAAGGLTLATASLGQREVTPGGAVLTHSAALFGMLLGGLAERTVAGNASGPLRTGMGWGTMAGLVTGGIAAAQWDVPEPSELLFIDLSAVLGGLAAAALGTPFVVGDSTSAFRDRMWLGGVMLGTVAGGVVGHALTGAGADSDNTTSERAVGRTEDAFRSSPSLQWAPVLGSVGNGGWGLGAAGRW